MRTLVLNAGYEPLAVITFRRALVLVLTGKASVVAEGDDPVVGPTDVLGRPSVILLNRYIRPRYNHSTAVSRRGVLRRDGHKCAYCGKAAHTIDHVHPKSRGGADSWENLVVSCRFCNLKKGRRTPQEASMTLLRPPQRPRWSTATQILLVARTPYEEWDPFLKAG